MIDCESEKPNEFPQKVTVRSVHSFRADVGVADGGTDSAPSPHDLFDASLAACKATTAIWYARHLKLPLERAEAHVERDASEERKGIYRLKVEVQLHGPLTEEQRKKIYDALERCPLHELMSTAEVIIETAPLEPAS